MHAELRPQVAFRLTGFRPAGRADPADAKGLSPALAARVRDLAVLRHDFPLVLTEAEDEFAVPLTRIVDRVMEKVAAPGAQGDTLRAQVLRLEREIRVLIASGASGSLSALWRLASSRLAAADADLGPAFEKAGAAVERDGEVLDCGGHLPGAFVRQAWKAAQQRKAERFHREAGRLVACLTGILEADSARSGEGRSAERLRHSMGTAHRDAFDFEMMSKLLGRAGGQRPLPEGRRRRIRELVAALESPPFFLEASGEGFCFDRCGTALESLRTQVPRMAALARSLAMARLEVENEYVESRHDPIFAEFRAGLLAQSDLAQFPDTLVCLRADDLGATEWAELLELLTCDAAVKVLVQTDDLLGGRIAEDLGDPGTRSRALAGMAVGLGHVFVLQSAASNLPALCDRVSDAIEYPGPAILSIYSGLGGGGTSLPPYLDAAAAMESRAFPAFSYDPRRANAGESGFSLENNPQADADWPAHDLEFEDSRHQRERETTRFTLVDFVAADARSARHFLEVGSDGPALVPVADWLDGQCEGEDGSSPGVRMVDGGAVLHALIPDEAVLAQALRCRDRWRRLKRFAAVARPAAEAGAAAPVADAVVPASGPVMAPAGPAGSPAALPSVGEAPASAVATQPASDDPYIETPRCTSCDECTQINSRLFAYDANKQAYVANPDAGTYRELVEAAESCQVSIIHPGKPRNAGEPGLDELLARAEAFR